MVRGGQGPWAGSRELREVHVQVLRLLERPVPRGRERGASVHDERLDPKVKGRAGSVRLGRPVGGGGGAPGEEVAGAEDEAGLRDQGADREAKGCDLGRSRG